MSPARVALGTRPPPCTPRRQAGRPARADRQSEDEKHGFFRTREIPRRPRLRRRAAAARPFHGHARRGRHRHAADPLDPAQFADPFLRDGHRHRGAARDRDGAGGRHRRHPPQSDARGSGRGGAQGQALRERHGRRSDHHLSRRDPRRRARADEARRDFRHSGRRARRGRQAGAAGRHPHQPRRALRRRSAPAGHRTDDAQGVTVGEGVGKEEARRLLHQHRIEKLVVVDDAGRCVGLITVKDIEKATAHPHAAKDGDGRLRVAAATTVGDKGFGAPNC